MKVIVFGAGHFGGVYAQQEDSVEIVAFCDNNAELWDKTFLGHKVISPNDIIKYEFDRIVICIDDNTMCSNMDMAGAGAIAMDGIFAQLLTLGIDERRISINGIKMRNTRRVDDLRKLGSDLQTVKGAVAECGVLRGHFAGYINEVFPDRTLYLFDTFSGFDKRDVEKETSDISCKWLDNCSKLFLFGNEKIAISRCPFPDNVIIRKGFVPDTFVGLEQEQFVFVNLDMDLYQPQLSALKFFAPRMARGGVILVHDYYNKDLPGVKQAVDEFAEEYKFVRIPTGDTVTVALCGFEKVEIC